MKRFLLRLSRQLETTTASGLTARQVEEHLKKAWPRLREGLDAALDSERMRIGACLWSLGWTADRPVEAADDDGEMRLAAEKALDWLRGCPDGKVIQRGMVSTGCGVNLTALHAYGRGEKISGMMEDLLRHVEVQRRKCLQVFSDPLRPNELWLERLEIGILFTRWSRSQKDLRFLNAAFKLIDFWFPHLKNHRDCRVFSRGCLWLAEQELSAKELLR